MCKFVCDGCICGGHKATYRSSPFTVYPGAQTQIVRWKMERLERRKEGRENREGMRLLKFT